MLTSKTTLHISSLALFLALGCAEDSTTSDSESDAGDDTEASTDGATDTATDADTSTDTDAGTNTDTDDSTGMGDAGTETDPVDPNETPDSGVDTDGPTTDGPTNTDDETDGDTGEDDTGEDDTDEETEASETDDATDPVIPGGPITTKAAYFAFVQSHVSVTVPGVTTIESVGAGFSANFIQIDLETDPQEPEPAPEAPCASVTVGSCTATFCEDEGEDPEEPAEAPTIVITELLPGGLTVTGLLVDPLEPEHIDPIVAGGGPAGLWEGPIGYNTFDQVAYWTGAETARILVTASADVPAFDLSFQPPSVIVLSSPTADASIPTSDDLDVTWTNGGIGDVAIAVGGSQDGTSRSIQCTVPSSAGSVEIDATLLEGLEGQGTLTVTAISNAIGAQDDWGYSILGQVSVPARLVTFTP